MSRWTIASALDECGYDGRLIGDLEPMQLVGPCALKRCQAHAHGAVDWAQVDAARHQREAAAERAAMTNQTPAPPAPVHRHRPQKPVRGFTKIGDLPLDLKAAAAGRDE